MRRPRKLIGAAAGAAALCTMSAMLAAGGLTAQATPLATGSLSAPSADAVAIQTPRQVKAFRTPKSNLIRFNPRIRVRAQGAPLEVWSKRASHKAPITTEVRSAHGTASLAAGSQKDFESLDRFFRIEVRQGGKLLRTRFMSPCLNSWETQRTVPEAPIRSPYPDYCGTNKFTKGYVMGVQSGWVSLLPTEVLPQAVLKPGTYQVVVKLTKQYADALGMSATRGAHKMKLIVPPAKKTAVRVPSSRHDAQDHSPSVSPRPAAHQPTADSAGEPSGPMPDLQSIPAWGIRINPGGNYLQFSATVWNAGSSPLVVDGFRRPRERVMDAYQYFIDTDGNQTGYQLVGEMEWDNKDTHQHWHFRDFARYRLLDADQQAVVRSRKEAFCLANTDVIDYTVPGADWNPEGTDLHTSCGGLGAQSLREVLSSGSGDTYAQFRAGQSFNLRGLANGTYYISVEANPVGRLIEEHTDNNIALRKVVIGGKKGARTVKIGPRTD